MANSNSHNTPSYHSSSESEDAHSVNGNNSDKESEFNSLQEAYDSLCHDAFSLKKEEVRLKKEVKKLESELSQFE